MNQYEITYSMNDMPEGYVGRTSKWARDEKSALKYILKKALKNLVDAYSNADRPGKYYQ